MRVGCTVREPCGSGHGRIGWYYPEWYVPTMNFYYVYILSSIYQDFLYVGFTHNLKKRFQEHNNSEELSTKHYVPFILIHYEAYRNEKDAKRREKYFKTTKGKTTLKTMLQEYFQEVSEAKANEDTKIASSLSEQPKDTILCPICHGKGEAPTRSYFDRNGTRRSGYVGFCQTCKGKGRILKDKLDGENYQI